MHTLPTRFHGVVDYLGGAVMAASPWLLGFARGEAETWIPVFLGLWSMAYSFLTDYELGAVPRLAVPGHLRFDLLSGLALAASPWILSFARHVWVPHLVLGLAQAATALLTHPMPAPPPPPASSEHGRVRFLSHRRS